MPPTESTAPTMAETLAKAEWHIAARMQELVERHAPGNQVRETADALTMIRAQQAALSQPAVRPVSGERERIARIIAPDAFIVDRTGGYIWGVATRNAALAKADAILNPVQKEDDHG